MLFIFALISGCSVYLKVYPEEITIKHHDLIFSLNQLALFIGPLLYLYIESLLKVNFSLRKQDWLHALPFVIAMIFSILIFRHYEVFHIWLFPERIYFTAFILIQNMAYCIATFRILHLNGLTFKSFLSYIDDSKLAWVLFFICGYIILWSVQFQIFIIWDVLQSASWCPYGMGLYFSSGFLLFNAMVYIGLKRPETFYQTKKYKGSYLKSSEKEQYQKKLISLMHQEKLYLNPNLSLMEIAQKLDILPRYASQIINETFQYNFYDFVNKYRIEESKRLLSQQDQSLNIIGIALDVGFNSKSTFNTAFKKHTGITPKEFKKKSSPMDAS
jgi:AraC-like DNA-binding protein